MGSSKTKLEPLLPGWVENIKKHEQKLSPVAQVYHDAQMIVLHNIAKSTDKLGRSLAWKAEAIKEDLAAGKDNDYVKDFVKEINRMVEKMLSKD